MIENPWKTVDVYAVTVILSPSETTTEAPKITEEFLVSSYTARCCRGNSLYDDFQTYLEIYFFSFGKTHDDLLDIFCFSIEN